MGDADHEVLISLCERVLSAEMTLDGCSAWPDPVESPALAPLREALEDGIEPTPGDSFCGVHKRRWQQMPEYDEIGSYLQRLREAKD